MISCTYYVYHGVWQRLVLTHKMDYLTIDGILAVIIDEAAYYLDGLRLDKLTKLFVK